MFTIDRPALSSDANGRGIAQTEWPIVALLFGVVFIAMIALPLWTLLVGLVLLLRRGDRGRFQGEPGRHRPAAKERVSLLVDSPTGRFVASA